MSKENNLAFLKERINEIKSAIFYSLASEPWRTPVSIISILKVDEQGQLWFFIKKPAPLTNESFPARLQFYRKGKPFYMYVSGLATLNEVPATVHDFTDIGQQEEETALQNLILVRMKMVKAEYYEQQMRTAKKDDRKNLLQNIY